MSISRQTVSWGIKVKSDPKHTVYVWLDALINYLSGINYQIDSKKSNLWLGKDTLQYVLLGKEITRFHIIYLPIIWKMLDIKLPDKYIAHGWLVTQQGKMSKSKGKCSWPFESNISIWCW